MCVLSVLFGPQPMGGVKKLKKLLLKIFQLSVLVARLVLAVWYSSVICHGYTVSVFKAVVVQMNLFSVTIIHHVFTVTTTDWSVEKKKCVQFD